ncbi:MAG: 16S rRNA (adenine(1518)-N(6)/adenine(1519)-N(6))-dimethyltransferase RsmA [Patescibacteria group bacterium]
MDLLKQMKEICRIYEISPKRSKGQNFLVTESIYDKIISSAEITPEDTIVEVGPGLGFLTAKLAKQAKKVIAVELDDRLAEVLKIAIDSQGIENVEIVNQDILRFNPEAIGPYKIVANIPYNISSILLRTFLGAKNKPEILVLMLQKEVALRICAQAPDMSMLALSVQFYGEPEIIKEVKAGNFWPEPKVDSAIIKIKIKETKYTRDEEKIFFRLAKMGFAAKRKMLKNNLCGGLKLKGEDKQKIDKIFNKLQFDPKIRAEDLSLENWENLFAELKRIVV